jgi:uncharacterized YigZ family protein
MNDIEEIKTIKKTAEYKFKEKGSLFLCKSFSISGENDVEDILSRLRKEYYDATHHCFAYRINSASSTENFKYSDDGEPSGTAGIRILNAIDHFGITNCLIVVIRYFGGTKLGVGPLGKAYYNSAVGALESSEIIIQKPFREVKLSCTFPQLNLVHRIMSAYEAKILDTFYGDEVKFICLVDANRTGKLKSDFTEASQDQIRLTISETVIYI